MGDILVRMKGGRTPTPKWHDDHKVVHHDFTNGGRVRIMKLAPGRAKHEIHLAIEKLNADRENVEWAEEDGEMQAPPPADGAAQAADWQLNKIGADAAHAAGYKGQGRRITHLDSGTDLKNPVLAATVVESAFLIKNSIQLGDTTLVKDGQDVDGHGTATHDCVRRVAPECKVYVGRVMYKNSAYWSSVGAGIIWGITRGEVTTISIGGSSNSLTLIDAIMQSEAAGVPVICAAGNYSSSVAQYPAQTLRAIPISSTDENDNRSGFSNFGDGVTTFITCGAPGSNIVCYTLGGGQAGFSGTSASAPIFAASLLLIIQFYGGNGYHALDIAKASAVPLGNVNYFGAGRVSVSRSLELDPIDPPVPPPPPPTPPPSQPPPSTNMDPSLSSQLAWSGDPGNTGGFNGKSEGLPQVHDGRADTKAVWLSPQAHIHLEGQQFLRMTDLRLVVANDTMTYPGRHPGMIQIYADGQLAKTVTVKTPTENFQEQLVGFDNYIEGFAFDAILYAKNGNVIQLAEFDPRGTLAPTLPSDPPPPPPPPPPAEEDIPVELISAVDSIVTDKSNFIQSQSHEMNEFMFSQIVRCLPFSAGTKTAMDFIANYDLSKLTETQRAKFATLLLNLES